MSSESRESITVVEVGPRDGFQPVVPFIPTDEKIAIVKDLIATGVSRIELGSFVSPSAIPQMRDILELLNAVRGGPHPELSVLVPNFKGAQLALQAGINNIVFVVSASASHNASNVNKTIEASMDELRRLLIELRPTGRFRFNLATAFDCPFEGKTPLDRSLAVVEQVLEWAPDSEICLCDTTGRALPVDVATAFQEFAARFGARNWAYHAHDTYGFGLATSWAAYEAGVRIFDASLAGLGGCPFAPGATGNVATEDLVYMFEGSGVATGIALRPLLEVARRATGIPGGITGGHIRLVAERRTARPNKQRSYRDELLDP